MKHYSIQEAFCTASVVWMHEALIDIIWQSLQVALVTPAQECPVKVQTTSG